MRTEKGANSGPELLVELDRCHPQAAAGTAGGWPARGGALGPPEREREASGHTGAGLGPRGLAPAGGRRLRAAAGRGLSRRASGSGHVRRRRRQRRGGARRRARVPGADVRLLPRLSRSRLLPPPGVAAGRSRDHARGARSSLRLPRSTRSAGAAASSGRAPAPGARSRRRSSVDRRLLGRGPGLRAAGACAERARAWRWRTPGCRRTGRSSPHTGRRSCRCRSTSRAPACTSSTCSRTGRAGRGGPVDVVLVTPAHQSPTGVALAPARRAALLEWAGAPGRWSSRTTTTPSTATIARRWPRCRGWRPTASSTWAPSQRRLRPRCAWAGWRCPRA